MSAMLALAGSYALTRNRLAGALVRSRFGWCGALPVRARTTAWTLLVLTLVALVVAILSDTLLLVFAAIWAPHPGALDFGLLALDGGLIVGTLAALHVLRTGTVARLHHADGIREPLFAMPWLNDPGLPHLLDWQRRAALVKWRRGGSLVIIVPILAVGPNANRTVMLFVVGLILLVAPLFWLAIVMRTCADVTPVANRLLGAVPLTSRRMRTASLRYPMIAAVGAVILAVAGMVLVRHGLEPAIIWIACAIVASAWSLRGVVRATGSGHPR